MIIKEFVQKFHEKEASLREVFGTHPDSYGDIVKAVVEAISDEEDYSYPAMDPNRIHQIDDGDYQGTLVFVIGARGYQPDSYWYVKVGYGSCSACDTLDAIRQYEDGPANKSQVDDYMKLALDIVTGLRSMQGWEG